MLISLICILEKITLNAIIDKLYSVLDSCHRIVRWVNFRAIVKEKLPQPGGQNIKKSFFFKVLRPEVQNKGVSRTALFPVTLGGREILFLVSTGSW